MRYKVEASDSAVCPGSSWSPYKEPVGEEGEDGATVYMPEGVVDVRRSRWRGGSAASIEVILNGREYRWFIEPAPTRPGLVRIARRLVREAAKGGE